MAINDTFDKGFRYTNWDMRSIIICKYFVAYANMVFDWNLRWYLLENIPHLPIILFILMFIFGVPSEMIKDRQRKNNGV